MTPWTYKGKPITCIEDCPKDTIGFIYIIRCKYPTYCINLDGSVNPEGKIYIGRKVLYNNKRTIISKRAKKLKPTRKKYNSVKTESNWLEYWGSSKNLLSDLEVIEDRYWSREIIEFCYSKRELSFYEPYYQFKLDVLFIDSYNDNILNRFFRSHINEHLEKRKLK